jgi:xanthine dehydrogenase large subunit
MSVKEDPLQTSHVATGSAIGAPYPHDSATLHVTGRAHYCDDIPLPANALDAAFGVSAVAHGRITKLDLAAVLAAPGVVAVAGPADIPGENNYGGAVHDDPIFTDALVQYAGQPIFAVAARSEIAARKAAREASIEYEELPAILDIRAALAAESYVLPSRTLTRGEPQKVLAASPQRLQGTVLIGGQDHFYLEGQIALAIPQESGAMWVHCSTQHPTEIQHVVAHALALPFNAVVVQCRRMGGGFGGKESQPALLAAAAAVLARKTAHPVKLRLDRDMDMIVTGKRHDFVADYDAGFDERGRLLALTVMLASRCGYSADLSGPVNDRAIYHLDNAYFLENVAIVSHRCKTHTVSNTAFRGFGGPQGMMVIERVMDDIARRLGLDPLLVRKANFYGIRSRNVTHYGQKIEDNLIPQLIERLEQQCQYRARRRQLTEWNAANPTIKRGLALTPVKFGISFTATQFNQAGALVHVYTDGTVMLNHGGTEMGQGLQIKVAQVVAAELGLSPRDVRVTATDTSKVPNTSATAASSGSDLNGMAARAAARAIRQRLVDFACESRGVRADEVEFVAGHVRLGSATVPFAEWVRAAYSARISLSSTGYYRTPEVFVDKATLLGRPFFYFAYGAAASEVELDTLTGETVLTRVDILHDVGDSLNPAIDRGQVEGGFLQGAGWLTSEELRWDPRGRLLTHAPSTYKIPTATDWPERANVELMKAPNRAATIYRSKAVGEPPLMLALSVFFAIRDACAAACASDRALPELTAPATPEAVLRAIRNGRAPGDASGH